MRAYQGNRDLLGRFQHGARCMGCLSTIADCLAATNAHKEEGRNKCYICPWLNVSVVS